MNAEEETLELWSEDLWGSKYQGLTEQSAREFEIEARPAGHFPASYPVSDVLRITNGSNDAAVYSSQHLPPAGRGHVAHSEAVAFGAHAARRHRSAQAHHYFAVCGAPRRQHGNVIQTSLRSASL